MGMGGEGGPSSSSTIRGLSWVSFLPMLFACCCLFIYCWRVRAMVHVGLLFSVYCLLLTVCVHYVLCVMCYVLCVLSIVDCWFRLPKIPTLPALHVGIDLGLGLGMGMGMGTYTCLLACLLALLGFAALLCPVLLRSVYLDIAVAVTVAFGVFFPITGTLERSKQIRRCGCGDGVAFYTV